MKLWCEAPGHALRSEDERAEGGQLRARTLTLKGHWDHQGRAREKASLWKLGEPCLGLLGRPVVETEVGEAGWEQTTEAPHQASVLRLWAMGSNAEQGGCLFFK